MFPKAISLQPVCKPSWQVVKPKPPLSPWETLHSTPYTSVNRHGQRKPRVSLPFMCPPPPPLRSDGSVLPCVVPSFDRSTYGTPFKLFHDDGFRVRLSTVDDSCAGSSDTHHLLHEELTPSHTRMLKYCYVERLSAAVTA